MMAPHVSQFVLCESSSEIRRRVSPRTPLQGEDVQPGVAKLLAENGAGPPESYQDSINGFQFRDHDLGFPPSRSAFEAHRRVRNALAMTLYPLEVIIVSTRESDHLPRTHVFVA